jgi:hypothetical protein
MISMTCHCIHKSHDGNKENNSKDLRPFLLMLMENNTHILFYSILYLLFAYFVGLFCSLGTNTGALARANLLVLH